MNCTGKFVFVLVLVCLLSLFGQGLANAGVSGKELKELKEYGFDPCMKDRSDDVGACMNMGMFIGYIEAVCDLTAKEHLFRIPNDLTRAQAVRVVVEYIENNPNIVQNPDYSAALVIILAMAQAFPY